MSLPFQDDQIGELAEETPPHSEKVETERQEKRDVDMEETVTTQVVGEKKTTLDIVIHQHALVVEKNNFLPLCSFNETLYDRLLRLFVYINVYCRCEGE